MNDALLLSIVLDIARFCDMPLSSKLSLLTHSFSLLCFPNRFRSPGNAAQWPNTLEFLQCWLQLPPNPLPHILLQLMVVICRYTTWPDCKLQAPLILWHWNMKYRKIFCIKQIEDLRELEEEPVSALWIFVTVSFLFGKEKKQFCLKILKNWKK